MEGGHERCLEGTVLLLKFRFPTLQTMGIEGPSLFAKQSLSFSAEPIRTFFFVVVLELILLCRLPARRDVCLSSAGRFPSTCP